MCTLILDDAYIAELMAIADQRQPLSPAPAGTSRDVPDAPTPGRSGAGDSVPPLTTTPVLSPVAQPLERVVASTSSMEAPQ
jgi:hypothetical protein